MMFLRNAGRMARVLLVPALAAAVLIAAAAPGRAQTVLVDSNNNFQATSFLYGSGANAGQQFTLSSGYTITSVSSTVGNFAGAATGIAYLYSNGGGSPGSLLYTSSTTVLPGTISTTQFDFTGADLTAGTYWVEFSTTSGIGRYLGTLNTFPLTGSAATLQNSILQGGSVTTPNASTIFAMGLTIKGTALASVPEPSSPLLGAVATAFGLGAGWARRNRSAAGA
ncbi:MAG: choice-of-anchor R domain-containing protein [Isosphaeraceae bacterium]